MCGIVYVKRLDHAKANKQALKRYSKQQHRGTEGYGYIGVKSNGTISPLARFQFEHELRTKLGASSLTEVLLHHRYPTSTPNVPEAAHPLLVANKELQYNYYVVHNGVLTNEETLREVHEGLGYRYLTDIKTQYRTQKGHVYTEAVVFNDSEAFAIELARTIEGLQSECNAKGAIAYIAYQVDKQSGKVIAVYFGTNGGNPLLVQRTNEFIAVCSEGAGQKVKANQAYRLDPITNMILECTVPLQPMHQESKIGYHRVYENPTDSIGWSLSESGGNARHPDNGGVSLGGNYTSKKDEDMSLAELEEELEAVDEEMIGLSGDILYSKNEGEEQEAVRYEQDYSNLEVRREKLKKLYESKALTA